VHHTAQKLDCGLSGAAAGRVSKGGNHLDA
jgi:hypothetical protein